MIEDIRKEMDPVHCMPHRVDVEGIDSGTESSHSGDESNWLTLSMENRPSGAPKEEKHFGSKS